MTILLVPIGAVAALWIFARFGLRGDDLTKWDEPRPSREGSRPEASPEHADVVEKLRSLRPDPKARRSRKERLQQMRASLDTAFAGQPVDAEIRPVDAGGVSAEWVLAPGADPTRRLLYIHGGAFMAGSPRSHRSLTARLSADLGVSVLSVDYRLVPEHTRADCVEDCCLAYRWILDNGPDGPASLGSFFVAGDSAGGNLTLVVLAWARDQGLRTADGAVAFSPATDGTFSAPSLRDNIATDPMLGPALRPLARVPQWILLLASLGVVRRRPQDPMISPVFGDLSNLPPLLVQASEAEILLDDARRYVNKARAAGSPATLQTWPGVVHVFQAFQPDLPEANEALERVAKFVAECESRG